ncbi:MAG: TonB-dependent receptor, partial [Pseudomonadota bacterium]
MFATAVAQDANQKYQFDISQGNLEEAVRDIYDLTGYEFLFPYELTNFDDLTPVKGLYTVDQAIDRMLAGTPLSGSLTESGMIVITQKAGRQARAEKGTDVRNIKMKTSLMGSVATFLFGMGVANPAFAQVGEEGASEDTIVVQGRVFRDPSDATATKLSTPLGETAGQVLVFNEDLADALGNLSVLDTIEFVPGVARNGTGGDGFFFVSRGFGLNRSNAFRLNGAPLGAGLIFDQVATSRLEFIKGAQAASYGQISAGGFINLSLKEADSSEVEGNLQIRGDSFGAVRGEVTYGGPLNESGTVRLLGAISRENG